jgi:hypothetical protein
MGSVAQLHDPEGDRLIRLAESLGEENLSEGEKWRLGNTLDRRRMLEARATQPSGRTDALDARAFERRLAALENQAQWAEWMLREILPQVVGETTAEAEERAGVDARKALEEIRGEIHAKIDALFGGFETAVAQLRGEDRTALLESVRETLGDADVRIDSGLAKALEAEKERSTIELALVRDEIFTALAERRYGVLEDIDPKLAEKAIAALRRDLQAVVEAEGSSSDRVTGVANQLAALEDAHHKARKGLIVRAATTAVLLKKETARANELAGKVERLEAALEQLTDALIQRKVI